MSIGVIGLGYVGLPLVVEFGKLGKTIGFDISAEKVASCQNGVDPSREIPNEEMAKAIHAEYTQNLYRLEEVDTIIIAVPTPVDESHTPDFTPLLSACKAVGEHMAPGTTVIFESTVYPGATEEICIPALEKASYFKWKEDFFVGYSPERINPGDRERTLTTILKVVSGDCPQTLDKVATLYESIVKPGVHRCSSIKVAEACKVIENTQRDLNIALMNELALIFHKIGIDTLEVLEAAGTKWNFLPFRPGLVGGHCIGVDPYYLTHKAEMLGYNPQVILSGRRINDSMGKYIAEQTVKKMIASDVQIKGSKVIILGITFKENCADIRNSKVVDIINELKSYGVEVFVHDPQASAAEVMHEYGIKLYQWKDLPVANSIVAAVAHKEFLEMSAGDFENKLCDFDSYFIDVKSAFKNHQLGEFVWRL